MWTRLDATATIVAEATRWRALVSAYARLAQNSDEMELQLAAARSLGDAAELLAVCVARAVELDVTIGAGAWPTDPSGPLPLLRRHAELLAEALRRCDPVADAAGFGILVRAQEATARHIAIFAGLASGDRGAGSLHRPAAGSPTASSQTVELLLRNLYDLELPTIDQAASAILDFPEMPLEFARDMARQCSDEARHAQLLLDRLAGLGASVGRPSGPEELRTLCAGRPLALRLALHQRWGEWAGVGGARWHADRLAREGDLETARIFAWIEVDEVAHVAIGNRWIRWLTPDPAGRAALDVEATRLRRAAGRSAAPDAVFPFDRGLCERCGFEPEDVDRLAAAYARDGSRFAPGGAQ